MDNPSVQQPASGTYGESAELEKLKQSLPAGAVGQPAPPGGGGPPMPPISTQPIKPSSAPPGRPQGSPPPPGISPLIMAPTDRPDVPESTPLQAPAPDPMAAMQTASQGRLALLYMLSTSPDVSPATREWAGHVINALTTKGR